MKKQEIMAIGVLAAMAFAIPALAATRADKNKTCAEFVQFDDVTRPKLFYWFKGFDRQGNPEGKIDLEQYDRTLPILTEECKKDPKHLLAKKLQELEKVQKK